MVRLTVGYHQLEGKRLQLKKPFAILQKEEAQGPGQGGTPPAPHGEAGGEGGGSSACASYQVRRLLSVGTEGGGVGHSHLYLG